MARYADRMERRCNYCWNPVSKLTVVVVIERQSGPPFIKRACSSCMQAKGLKPL
jgi:hypothetical protein